MVHCNPRKRDCLPRIKRHLRSGCGDDSATINNKVEFEGQVAANTSFNLSAGGLNVNATNRGHTNALCKSDHNSINNDA